jgi:hypothetical protein
MLRLASLQAMENQESEGLGLSVLIYLGAILGMVAVVATPIYFAVRPQVYENPVLARTNPLLDGPIVGQRVSAPTPLAYLKHEQIIDPAVLAQLNSKIKGTSQHTAHRSTPQQVANQTDARPRGTPVAELRDGPRPSGFFARLFGG